ncbi:MAG: DNA-processing protein DprA [Candidatus Omnitrophota bacterium]
MSKEAFVFLNLIDISPRKIREIICFLKDPDDIFSLKHSDLKHIPSLNERDIEAIKSPRSMAMLDNEIKGIKKKDISLVDFTDHNYPGILNESSDPPPLLYVKGDPGSLLKENFAIVGSRIPTIYGKVMAEEFAFKLASFGLTIVSGLARGIDSLAHKGALAGGKTIAVLGSGLSNIYPKENIGLAEKISHKGAVISEFPLMAPPLREHFPRRNRIISGLSKGILVVEAAKRSGSLITAHIAAEENREVFALPGNADSPLSKGTHQLLKDGAKLVDCVEDILEEFNITFENAPSRNNPPLDLKVLSGKGVS